MKSTSSKCFLQVSIVFYIVSLADVLEFIMVIDVYLYEDYFTDVVLVELKRGMILLFENNYIYLRHGG